MSKSAKPLDLPDVSFDYGAFAKTHGGKGEALDIASRGLKRQLRTRSIIGAPDTSGEEAAKLLKAGAEAEELLKAGAEAVELLSQEPKVALTPLQAAGLEAVVRLEDRPALFVRQDKFQQPPERWEKPLRTFEKDVLGRLPVVGGISFMNGGKRVVGGTGFVVAPNVVLTNRHVLELLGLAAQDPMEAQAKGAGDNSPWKLWHLDKTVRPAIDFKVEDGRKETKQFEILEVLAAADGIERPTLDTAFLRVAAQSSKVEGGSEGGEPLPPVVEFASSAPDVDVGRELYAIGYPVSDNESLPADPGLRQKIEVAMAQIFGGVYSVKRLQPGELRTVQVAQGVFAHDCSTLGGNSGSCMVDLTTNQVVGIHFKGKRLTSNWAVALWLLKEDPYLRNEIGVKFA